MALGFLVSGQKIFKVFISKIYFKPLWPRYETDQNRSNNFGRGPPKDHLYEIISKLDLWFRRSCHLSKLLTDTDDGQGTKTDHKSSPCHYVTGKLKNQKYTRAVLKINSTILNRNSGTSKFDNKLISPTEIMYPNLTTKDQYLLSFAGFFDETTLHTTL